MAGTMLGVVFDLDGTLVDTAPDIHRVANEVLALEGLAPFDLPQVRSFIGEGLPVLVQRLLAARGEPEDGPRHARMVAAFAARYHSAFDLTAFYPGARETLDALAAAGHPLALCTNKPIAATRALLAHFELAERFAVVVGGDSLPERKPHPAPLLKAVAGLGLATALFVGDSETDAETATRAGLPFALFTEGYRKRPVEALPHVARFGDFADLPALVASIAETRV